MDPGVINADIVERIQSKLEDLLDLVKSIQGGNEQAPGGYGSHWGAKDHF
jgi:hypothetical protein